MTTQGTAISRPANNDEPEDPAHRQWRLDYFAQLQSLKNKNQADADKAVLTLSGGALALSVTFLQHVIPLRTAIRTELLACAWLAWMMSIGFSVSAYFFAVEAMNSAMQTVRAQQDFDPAALGGRWNRLTRCFTIVSGILFVIGLGSVLWFASANFGLMEGATTDERSRSATGTATTTTTTTSAAADTHSAPEAAATSSAASTPAD